MKRHTPSPFNLALEAWQAGADLRQRRERYKRYTYGRQWQDTIEFESGKSISEYNHALLNGRHPLTNNLIRQLVKCVIGNFRSRIASGDDPASANRLPEADMRRNALIEMDCRMLEEFLISGCAIQRVTAEKRTAGSGVWIDNISPADFFVNRFCDPRGLDIELIGMLHSMSFREAVMRYGNCRPDSMAALRRAFDDDTGSLAGRQMPLGSPASSHRFFNAGEGRCRIIEVWTADSRNILRCHDRRHGRFYTADAASAGTMASDSETTLRPVTTLRWHCRIYTPAGDLLDEYDSPYLHGMHPFAVKFYPLIDGEVHSLVEDILDQQRCINHLITLVDQIMRTSAKGVLLFPNDQLPDNMTAADVADCWSSPDGVIFYNPGYSSHEPHQIHSGADFSGAYRLLETQLNLFQQISGVSDALQGRTPPAQTSAALYDSQMRSAAIALLDLLDTFNTFRSKRNEMALRV